jgi:hypothetical protein
MLVLTKPLGYPQAALFGFCVALVAYNAMVVVFAALRSVHGAEKIDQEMSGYYIANEIAETYRGLNIAIPEPHWQMFVSMSAAEFASILRQLASKVRLRAFRKHPRGPKKPPPKRYSSAQQPHVWPPRGCSWHVRLLLMHLKRAGADLLNVLMLMQHPSARMPLKAEMGIVVRCRRSRQQDQLALGAQALFRETNKLLPYTSPLY